MKTQRQKVFGFFMLDSLKEHSKKNSLTIKGWLIMIKLYTVYIYLNNDYDHRNGEISDGVKLS